MESLSKIALQYFGLPLEHRQIWRLKVSAANYYQNAYSKIFEKIIKGNLIHADEFWRNKGIIFCEMS